MLPVTSWTVFPKEKASTRRTRGYTTSVHQVTKYSVGKRVIVSRLGPIIVFNGFRLTAFTPLPRTEK